jgi:hypothetical protein
VGLKKDNKISIPNSSFDNEAIRYDHRFAPFNNMLTPPSMPYRFERKCYVLNLIRYGKVVIS